MNTFAMEGGLLTKMMRVSSASFAAWLITGMPTVLHAADCRLDAGFFYDMTHQVHGGGAGSMVLDVHSVYSCARGTCFVGKAGATYAEGDDVIGSYSGNIIRFRRYIEPSYGTPQNFTGRCTASTIEGQFSYSAGTGTFRLFLD